MAIQQAATPPSQGAYANVQSTIESKYDLRNTQVLCSVFEFSRAFSWPNLAEAMIMKRTGLKLEYDMWKIIY